jgi:hypothetical protein
VEIVALLESRKLNSQGSGLTAADVPEQADPVIVRGVANAVAVNAPIAAVAQPKLRANTVPEIHQMTAKQMIRQYQELLVTTDVLDLFSDSDAEEDATNASRGSDQTNGKHDSDSDREPSDRHTDRDKAWLASAPDSDERCNLENELVKYTKGKATRVMIRQNAQKLLASKA